jgi:hypothetical protein
LVQGELAVNVTDKRLFTENASTQIVELGTNPSTVTTTTATVSGTLTANGTFASSNAVVTGGSINSTPIGAVTPSTVRGSTVTATTGFVGGLTGNVVGNVTGNVTGNVVGNVTGDLTGNVTASTGTSTVNNLVVNGTVDFSNTRLTDVAEPIAGSDAATKTYVDTSIAAVIDGAPAALDTLNELAAALNDDASFHTTVTNALTGKLALSGGTMTGQLSLGANKIVSVADPTLAQDVATKAYVDAADTTGLPLAGGTMSGAIAMGTNKITGLGTPTDAADATTKAYTDSILGSATSAADSAAAAATSASNASTSASNASSSATAASGSETAAALSATNAAASYDSFDDRYLGAKASDPTVDNDGDALIAGATYFNTTVDSMKVYSGSAWSDVAPVATSVTLSQVTDFPTQSGQSGKYLTTNGTVPNWATLTTDPTLGTLTKTFTNGESASISLTSSVLAPVVSVTKEVPQTGSTNNSWDVNSTTENYTRLDSAAATTLDWDVGGVNEASLGSNFYVGSQDGTPQGVSFNNDGTILYMVGQGNASIFQYNLTTSYSISTASYASISLLVSSQDTQPLAVEFNTDGTKMFLMGGATDTVYEYNLATAYNVSTAVYSQSFSVTAQDTFPNDIAFNQDGTKMFMVGRSTNSVYLYNLTTGFDLSTASYSSTSFSVASQETSTRGLSFNQDGSKMIIVGITNDTVYQYNLTTGFDISTASYSSLSFSVASQATVPLGITGNSDLSKFYIVENTADNVYEYTVPSTLALGAGSFASADVGKTIEANSGVFVLTATDGSYAQTTAPTSYAQVASGSWEMYGVVYNTTDGDLELSGYKVGWNLSGGAKDGSNQFTGTGTIECSFLGNNGTKLYQQDFSARLVREYNLSTAYDLTTATSTGNTINSQSYGGISEGSPRAVFVSPDGVHLYTVGSSNGRGGRFDMSTPWDLSTASYVQLYDFGMFGTPFGLVFSPDGLNAFLLTGSNQEIRGFSLSTAWDITTISADNNPFSLNSNIASGSWEGLSVSEDGTRLFPSLGTTVYEVKLATPWVSQTASYTAGNDLVTPYTLRGSQPIQNGLQFTVQNGNKVEIWNTGLAYFSTGYQPVHTTASTDTTYWTDINSMTADQAAGDGNVYYCISTDDRTTWTVIDNADGERDIVRNNAGTWQYNSNGTYASETWVNGATNTELATLAEAMEGAESVTNVFDISTASYLQSFSVASQETGTSGLAFNSDGTKMFVCGYSGDDVNEYALTTGFDVSTASYTQAFSVAAQDILPRGLAFNADGTKMFFVGQAGADVNEYTLSTGFDVSTASFVDSFSVSAQGIAPIGLAFNTDGTKMFVTDRTTLAVSEYTLSTGFDVSTASFVDSFSAAAQLSANGMHGVEFNDDGTQMFLVGQVSDAVYQYTLTTGFDVSTASYSQSFSVSSQETSPMALAFSTNGAKMFVVGQATNSVYQYSVGTTAYTNQMDKAQLDAVTDPNHIALGNDFDLSIILNMTSGTTVPSSNGVAINYDANILNKGAVLGTDYDFDAPAQNKVRITALAANNLKVRVV